MANETAAPTADAAGPSKADDGLITRRLAKADFGRGFLQLLAQLSVVGDVDQAGFEARFDEIDANPDYHIFVIEDPATHALLGAATLLIERKFLRGCGSAGHVEDVVVDAAARGKRLGARLIAAAADAAREAGCYKIILDCSEGNVAFYEKCGLVKKEVQMVKYF